MQIHNAGHVTILKFEVSRKDFRSTTPFLTSKIQPTRSFNQCGEIDTPM